MGCKQSTTRKPPSRSSQGSVQQRGSSQHHHHQHQHGQKKTSASSHRNSSTQRNSSNPTPSSPGKPQTHPRLQIQSQNLSSNPQSRGSSRNPSSRSSPQQTPLQKPTPLQSRHSSQNNSKVIGEKVMTQTPKPLVAPPKPLVPPPPPSAVTMTGRLGRPYLYRQQSPISSSTSSSSYFNSTDMDEEDYDEEVEAALLMTPRGSRSNRSRDSSPTSDSKTIHVNRGFSSNSARRRQAAQGRLNRSRRRASLHANARDEFVQKAAGIAPGIGMSGSPTSAIDYSRAGGSFIDDPHAGGGHIAGNDVYYDGGEAEGEGGFFAGERQFLPYKYKNVHDPGHYCSSTAMVVVPGGGTGGNDYRGSGMGSVTKSSSSPLGFRRARRKHFKHNSSHGTMAGSPCGPGSAVLSSSSPLGFRRSRRGHATQHSSSNAGSPSYDGLRTTTGSTAKFQNSSSTTGPTNNINGSNGGSVGSGGPPMNHDASIAYSSPNHDVSVGNMIMSRTLGPPETTPYYFGSKNGSNNSHNTTNNGYNSSQTGAVAVMKNGKGIATPVGGGGGGGSVSGYPATNMAGGNNIFYQKGVVAVGDEDEYFI